MIDTERLLAPVADADPCGPDLEYDADFQALEQAARGVPEQEIGRQTDGTPIRKPGVPPNWIEVRERAEALCGRTKDLRVAIRLAQALSELEGLDGLAAGLAIVRGLIDRYWDAVHPRIDDDGDATFRTNVLQLLTDNDVLLRSVRGALVAPAVRAGRVTVRTVLVAMGQAPAGDEAAPGLPEVEALLGKSEAAHPGALRAASLAMAEADAIRDALRERLGAERATDLRALRELLRPAADLCARLSGDRAGSAAGSAATSAAVGADDAPARESAQGRSIRSREDAVRELERVCLFIEQAEPSHPAPLLIRRAQRLLRMNFLEIMQDLAPDSVSAIQHIAGSTSE